MNEVELSGAKLPGLEVPPVASLVSTLADSPAPRVRPVNRSQLIFRTVDLEQLIEEDHPARAIWELSGQLDLEAFYQPIGAVEGVAGRRPFDPRLLISLWIYGYSRGISSAREMERRCDFDPAFQWLCGGETINHHTLSDFRVTHGEALQELFAQLLATLSAEGLISLERVMQDGTKIRADAGHDTFRRQKTLESHLEEARQRVQSLAQEPTDHESKVQHAARQRAARQRQQRLERSLEELKKMREDKTQAKEKEAVRASTSDPEARIMKQAGGGFAPCYNVQLSTEASHKIVVATSVSQDGTDYAQLVPAVAQVEENLQAKPKQVVADGGFTSRENILSMAAQEIDFVGSLGDQQVKGLNALEVSGADQEFCSQAFQYDASQDVYRCPAGQVLKPNGQDQSRVGVVRYQYRAQASVCQACPLKGQCCPKSTRGRLVSRLVEAPEVQKFREKMETPETQEIYRQRGPVAEFPNAWIKEKIGLRRFRVRGLVKVGLEVLWACLTYNIQQWVRLCWRPSVAAVQN